MTAAALLAFRLRRERVVLPVWLVGATGLLAASGVAIVREFGDEAQRSALIALASGNPAFLFLRGLPDGAGVGAVVFFQTFSFLAVLTALMNTFLVVRHTRADEERGQDELLLAAPVRRAAPLVTALAVALLADVLLAGLATTAGLVLGLDPAGSVLTGLALGAVGLCFAGGAAVCAQVMPTPRGANGLAAATVGVAYLVRGAGDALGTARDLTHVDPSWVSLLSPIGWAQASRPFSDANALPLLVPLLAGVVAGAVAILVRSRRDLGASLFAQRAGRPGWRHAGPALLGIRGQIGTTIGWATGTAILGFLAGLITPLVVEAVGANDELAGLIARLAPGVSAGTGDVFTMALLGIAGTLATAAGVQAVTRLRTDEAEGRAELLLATPMSSTAWYLRQLAVAVSSTAVVAVVAGLAAGTGFVASGSAPDRIGVTLEMVLVQLPAGIVFIALAALAVAALPRLSIGLAWVLLVAGLVLGQLGDLLGLPDAVQSVSPFRHVPAVPIEPVTAGPLVVPAVVAIAIAGFGALILRRRDIPA